MSRRSLLCLLVAACALTSSQRYDGGDEMASARSPAGDVEIQFCMS